LETIGDILAYDPMGLLDTSSRRHWALQWIANQDSANLDFSETPSHVVVERYVMVLFFNENGGESLWRQRDDFLSETSTCKWSSFAVACRGGDDLSDLDLREYFVIFASRLWSPCREQIVVFMRAYS
jgi:hypothetical protein